MKKFSFPNQLKSILFIQDLRENPKIYKDAGLTITGGHPGIDISHGDMSECYSLYDGDVVYTQFDTVVVLSDPDENGLCLEINYGHMQEQKVVSGDRVKSGDLIGLQDCVGPSVMWQDNTSHQDKISWSHQHIGFREARRLSSPAENKNYEWNYQWFSKIPYEIIEYDSTIEHFRDPNLYCQKVVYRIADAIKRKEGMDPLFNNPGALRYSPFQTGTKNGFAVFNTYQDGYNALVYQLSLAATDKSSYYKSTMTINEFFSVYAPSSDNNDPFRYAKDVVEWSGLNSELIQISDWMLTDVEWLKKHNSTPFLSYPEITLAEDPSGNMSSILKMFKYLWNVIFK